jgi:hypothetical protein
VTWVNRDDPPNGAVIALATGELMVTARRAVAERQAIDPADAVAAVRAAVGQLWPKVPPEAVRDVMVAAAKMAREFGVTELPATVADQYSGQLDGADGMLELTGEWIAAGKPAPTNGPFTPPIAFASSVAFDRDEDEETLTSLAALLALAHMAMADRADHEEGMSEYRYDLPDDPI